MKTRRFALAMALMFALTLTGCSANREEHSSPVEPDHTTPGAVHSDSNDGNDAMEGGGAGGTNDQNNDGHPDNSAETGGQDGDNALDDIGDAAGDLARGAGDMIRGAGDAIGDAANDVGRAMH